MCVCVWFYVCASYLCHFLSFSLSLLFCLTISLSETETHTRCVCVCVSYSLFLSLYNRYDFNVVTLECVSSSLFYLSVTTMQPNLIGRDILRERALAVKSNGCSRDVCHPPPTPNANPQVSYSRLNSYHPAGFMWRFIITYSR